MGSDFRQRAGKTLKRSWDEGRVAMATPDLFTREPICVGRAVAAEIADGVELIAGEAVTLEIESGVLIARRRLTVVARSLSPAAVLVETITASCNIRPGTIDQVHVMAGMVEILVC
jgi:hypothetical protein